MLLDELLLDAAPFEELLLEEDELDDEKPEELLLDEEELLEADVDDDELELELFNPELDEPIGLEVSSPPPDPQAVSTTKNIEAVKDLTPNNNLGVVFIEFVLY